MHAQTQPRPLSVAEYLERERSAKVRHEYLAGQLFALAGASEAHNTIALNIAAELRARLRGSPCRVFITDMKLRIRAADTFYYPDVFVTCNEADRERYYKEHPSVIFEVLSPGTESTDRREKFLLYRQLESLREFVLVNQDERVLEVYRRDRTGDGWSAEEVREGDRLRLESVGIELPLAEIYLDVPAGPGA